MPFVDAPAKDNPRTAFSDLDVPENGRSVGAFLEPPIRPTIDRDPLTAAFMLPNRLWISLVCPRFEVDRISGSEESGRDDRLVEGCFLVPSKVLDVHNGNRDVLGDEVAGDVVNDIAVVVASTGTVVRIFNAVVESGTCSVFDIADASPRWAGGR